MRGTSSIEGVGQDPIRKLLRKNSEGCWHFMGGRQCKGVTWEWGGGLGAQTCLCAQKGSGSVSWE